MSEMIKDYPLPINDSAPFDVLKVREDFPILKEKMYGKPLVFFDNGATSQKPQIVIDRINQYYSKENSNIHRGVYKLSQDASANYEDARKFISTYLNAISEREIVFTRGATEGLNLIASSWGRQNLKAGDEILISYMEHHANIVPWQIIAQEKGAILKAVPINADGIIDIEVFKSLITEKTKIISLVYISNGIGTINPIHELVAIGNKLNIPVVVDACQAAPHIALDVQDLGCDFLVFSGHKTFGPTGIGILYGKESLLESMPPYQGGGDMIKFVSIEKTEYNELPFKFEAGTPHISGAIALATALQYFQGLGMDKIHTYEESLKTKLISSLLEIEGLTILGNPANRIPLASFIVEGVHPLDLGTMLDFQGIAIRTGNHCTQPLIQCFGYSATCRASLSFYNTFDEIDFFKESLIKIINKIKA